MQLNFFLWVWVVVWWASGCGDSYSSLKQDDRLQVRVDTRTLTDVAIVPQLREGDSFIWGYYPGAGNNPRMYEGYIKLPDLKGRPTLALVTLFPEEAPAGTWILHDGIGFDYDEVVTAFSAQKSRRRQNEQMFSWDNGRKEWIPSTNHPNTSANIEKFNYRRAVSRNDHSAWRTLFGCYDGRDVIDVSSVTGACDRGETVFQQIPADDPPYVFQSFYSLATGVALFKLFNKASSDPDAHVAMRLVYGNDKDGERTFGDRWFSPAYLSSFKAMVHDVTATGHQ